MDHADRLLQAVDAGDTAAVRALLEQDRSLANATYQREGATLPILYFACMSDHVEGVNLLLQHGASTQDGESIYHAAQHNRRECLELLLAHGADLSEAQQQFGNTPLYFLAGHHDGEDIRAAWLQGVTWLLEHGADPNVPSGDGRTPYQLAVRRGNRTLAALLREHGANTTVVTPVDEFLGACLDADEGHAREVLARHPGLFDTISADDQAAMTHAVHLNRPDAIRLMVDLGFTLDRQRPDGGTPLHWAAWLGKVELVDLLIGLGSPIDLRDTQYGGSALGWAAHGSECHHDDDSYCAIVDTLIDAGATRELTINKWGEKLLGTPRVTERLKARFGS